jgi:hypothetical protein
VSRDVPEIRVSREQHKLMTDAELSDQGVNRTCLNSAPAAAVLNLCSEDMIRSVRREEREGCKALNDLFFGLWTGEPLQEFLKNQAG